MAILDNMKDTLSMRGFGEIDIIRLDGTVEHYEFTNTITNAGKAQLALLAGDATAVPFTYLALGTSNTAPAASQTALSAEITTNGLQRAVATVSRVTTTQTNDTLQLYKLFTATGSSTVEEVGVFNDPTAGTMLARALTTSKPLVSGESIAITYKVAFS